MLLTADQFASLASVDRATIYRWTEEGICPRPRMIDGRARWAASTIDRWAAQGFPPCPRPSERYCIRARQADRREFIERMAARSPQTPDAERDDVCPLCGAIQE